jgi:EAL domain-containing protein (putative c-di-GMP-specific phosphodiesterase class I)
MGVIHSLHEMGYQISMDDFGSGYSSLELLNLLPLDVMKLDRTLLGHQEDGRMEKILSASIDLGNSLEMDVICEGIEDVSQEALLLKYGCRYGQGYLYAKPMPREEFEDFLSRH